MEAASRLTTKGQVTIPKAVREALGLDRGRRRGLSRRGAACGARPYR